MPRPSRPGLQAALQATLFAATFASAAEQASSAEPVELLQSSEASVRFRVAAPDLDVSVPEPGADATLRASGFVIPTEPAGAPALPRRSINIAIPPGTKPILTYRVLSSSSRPGVWPEPIARRTLADDAVGLPVQSNVKIRDAASYGRSYPAEFVSLESVGNLRHLALASIAITPYRWNPGLSGVEVATELEVEVRFEPVRGINAPRLTPLRSEPEEWQRLYRRSVLNSAEADRFLAQASAARTRPFRAPHGEFRLTVENNRIHRVTYQALAAAQWTETPPIDQLALNERSFSLAREQGPFVESPVPIRVIDRNGNGIFDTGDELYFLGRNAWSRLHPPNWQKRYGRRNAYYLSVRPEGGARMAPVTSDLGRSDLTPEATTVWAQQLEGDGIYMKFSATSEPSSLIASGVTAVTQEHFYWFGGANGQTSERQFDLPGFVSPVRLELAMQGVLLNATGTPVISFGPVGGALTEVPGDFEVSALSRRVATIDGGALGNLGLRAAANRISFQLPEGVEGPALDWMRWTYNRNFTATADEVSWSTATELTGPREFRPAGFSVQNASNALLAFDTTDSLAPKVVTYTEAQLLDSGRSVRLQFEPAASRSFVVLRPNAAAQPIAIAREGDEDLAALGDEDVIVVTAPELRPALEPWITRRENQGFHVKVVLAQDLYDQFNGGRAWPDAIRNYLRYQFANREVDPSYLLLFGDASDDFAKVTEPSDTPAPRKAPNFVPTQTLFSNALNELVASDYWYVDNLDEETEQLDFLPDMNVGRLSVGSAAEAATMVDKVLQYEQWSPNDAWRNRGLLVSDDEYSNRIGFSGFYTWAGDRNRPGENGESVFTYAGRRTRSIIQREAGFSDFECDSFYVAQYMDTVACLGRCIPDSNGSSDCRDWRCPWVNNDLPNDRRVTTQLCYFGSDCPASCPSLCDNQEYGVQVVSPLLLNEMSRGHLFVSYNGHANGKLCAHEYILQENASFQRFDTQRMLNVGKPFIFMGYGCHLAEFSIPGEYGVFVGDGMAERMMLQADGRGAIATIASTGYEWLEQNDFLNIAMFQAWFLDPPTDGEGRTRWRLGDLFTGGKVRLLQNSNDLSSRGMVPTYALLGDPTMAVDLAPPRLSEVTVNGTSWAGDDLAASAEDDSAQIEILLSDESMIESVAITDRDGPVDPSRFRLLPDPTRPNDGRRRLLHYASRLVTPPSDYVIRVAARDRAGRDRTLELPVRLTARLFAKEQGTYREVQASDFLAPGDSIRIEFSNPIDLDAREISLRVNDELLGGVVANSDDATHPRTWSVRARLSNALKDSGNRIALRIERSGAPTAERSFGFQVASEQVDLLGSYNFPNPFAASTRFYYTLNGGVESARVSIFTLRGRKILSLDGPTLRGDNSIEWNGTDQDGDPVANGLYFYKVEIKTLDGRRLEKIDRVARVQ